MSLTRARVIQYIGILLALGLIAVAYWYFSVRASTVKEVQNGLVTNGLVGFWSFNDPDISGTTAYDRSGAGNNGTLSGGPTQVAGEISKALDFDGTDAYVNVPGFNQTVTAATFTAWVNLDAIDNYDGIVFSRGSDVTGMNANNTGSLGYHWNGAVATYNWDSGLTLPIGQWTFVAITVTSTQATAYLGSNAGSLTSAVNTTGHSSTTLNALKIGQDSNNGRWVDGRIDEVRVYNRALSADEIRTLYTARGVGKTNTSVSQPQGTGRLDSGLAGYWKLDENTGTSAGDSSTNGNTGTLTGAGGLPTWTTGQIGSGIDFDGTDDYIEIGSSLKVNNSDRGTISAWIYLDTTGIQSSVFSYGGAVESGFGDKLQFGLSSGNVLMFKFRDDTNGVNDLTGTTALVSGSWYHVAITSNSSQYAMYLNGVKETLAGSSNNGMWFADVVVEEPDASLIGAMKDDGIFINYFNGKIDEVRIYDRPLSDDEVSQLYRLTTPTGVDTGLKGYWSFNGQDMNGNTAYDRSGAGNSGTLTNGPTITEGKLGQALSFDGTDDYVGLGTGSSLNPSAVTITAWVKFNSLANAYTTIVSKVNGSSAYHQLFVKSNGKLAPYVRANGSVYYDGTGAYTLVTGQWYHLALSYDSSSGLKGYVNGSLDGSVAANGTLVSNSSATEIGRDSNTAGRLMNGSIDEVRIYDRALSAGEIKSLYDVSQSDKVNSAVSQPQGTGRLDSGLAGYWKLDENTGTSAADATGHSSAGTLTGAGGLPTWTTGQIGSGIDFDGTDDYIALDSSKTYIDTAKPFSVSLWLNPDVFDANNHVPFAFNSTGVSAWIGTLYSGGSYADFSFGNSTESANRFSFPGGVTTGVWRHVTITYNGNGFTTGTNYAAYVDGASVTVNDVAGSFSPGTNQNSLGRYSAGSGFWDGKLDEVRIYNRALSADEVSQLYRLTTPTGTDTSLKGYWSFNGKDVSGTTAYDRSGSGNNGTLTNGPTITEGKLGQALNFDGSDDYVDAGDSTVFEPSTDITITAWIYPTASGNYPGIVTKSNSSSEANCKYSFYLSSTTRKLSFAMGGGLYVSTALTVPLNQWSFVSVSQNNTNLTLSLNGSSETSTTLSAPTYSTETFKIGAWTDAASTKFFGKIDEVRIYNRALSAAEIAALYNSSR